MNTRGILRSARGRKADARIQRQWLWLALPVVGLVVSEWRAWRRERTASCFHLPPLTTGVLGIPPYPLDMGPLLALPHGTVDEVGVAYNLATRNYPAGYQPTTIANYGLANWNAYLTTGEEEYKERFMAQARWLVAHETPLVGGAGGWYLPFSTPYYGVRGPWLSAMTQGNAISVLVRAYRLTNEDAFLQSAHRAVRLFERDIRDGGVSTSIGGTGLYFEEVAAEPRPHILNGYLFALFGLRDYVDLTNDERISALVERSLATLHEIIDRYDMGYWSYYDLCRKPATLFYHSLHVTMLEALARATGCEHCRALAAKWDGYRLSATCRTRYVIHSRLARYRRGLQRAFGGKPYLSPVV